MVCQSVGPSVKKNEMLLRDQIMLNLMIKTGGGGDGGGKEEEEEKEEEIQKR